MGVNELDYKMIGQRIRAERNKKGWQQAELAFRAGMTSAHLSHIETAQTKLALPTIVKIANALSVSVDELLYDSMEQVKVVYDKKIAEELTQKSGDRTTVYGTAINNYRADWINWMGNYDADWFADGKSNLSSPEAMEGLGVMYDLVQAGSAPSPGSVSATGDSEDRLFITGQVAMYPSGRWVIPSFRTECDFEWDAVEMPQGTTRTCPFICSMVCIANSSENKDVAANLLSFQMSDEGLGLVMESALSLPVYSDLMANEDYVNTPPSADAFINSAEYLGNKSQIEACQTGKWSEYSDIITARLSDAFEGKTTLEEAVKLIDEQANSTVFTE